MSFSIGRWLPDLRWLPSLYTLLPKIQLIVPFNNNLLFLNETNLLCLVGRWYILT